MAKGKGKNILIRLVSTAGTGIVLYLLSSYDFVFYINSF